MPSIDYFYTSKYELLENLPMVFENKHHTQVITSPNIPSSGNSYHEKTFQTQHDSMKTPSTSFGINAIPNDSITSSEQEYGNLHKHPSANHLNRTQEIFSQNLNKHSTEDNSNFKVPNYSMEERLL